MPTFGNRFYKQPGIGGGGAATTYLSYDDKASEVIPASTTAGTITMAGDTWQVRGLTTTTRQYGMSQGWRIEYAVPSGFMDGGNKQLRWVINFTSDPTTASNIGVRIGFHEPSKYGVGGGLDYGTSAGNYRATVGLLSTVTKGVIVAASRAEGLVQVPGTWDGATTAAGSVCSSLYSATVTSSAGDENGSGSTYTRSGSLLTVHIGNGILSSSGPDDFDFTVGYQVVDSLGGP